MKKYFRILCIFSKISLQNQMAYRPSFILAIVGKAIRMLILILAFQVIYLNTPLLAGWKYEEIFLLIVTFLTIESIIILTFHRNLSYYLPDMLRNGQFDFLLTKPLNSLFYTSFRVVDLMDLTSFVLVIYLWYYYFTHYAPIFTIWQIVLYLGLIVCALIFVFSILVIIASTAFWTINTDGLGRLFENIVRIARFPTDVFRGIFSILFLYVFPIGIVATLPSKLLLGTINWYYLIYAVIFTGALFLISRKVWNHAINHYSSASS